MVKIPLAALGKDESVIKGVLQSAQGKLNINEAAYTLSQADYQKAMETRFIVQQELAKIKGNLKNQQLQLTRMEEIQESPHSVHRGPVFRCNPISPLWCVYSPRYSLWSSIWSSTISVNS